jgi:predicted RNA-binding Zn ribbon-like protein
MLRVTWEWLGFDPALDVANTVAVAKGVPYDLLAPEGEYERWADAAASASAHAREKAAALLGARARVLELREHIRAVLYATAAGDRLPEAAVAELNAASRLAPRWPELRPNGELSEHAGGRATDRLLAAYARSAMEIAAGGSARLRVCPAPSCGMFYRPGRPQQRWCSTQCGSRARFARHYRARRG